MLYTVLPDGSIFKLETHHDFITASIIVKDEAGDLLQTRGGDSFGAEVLSISCRDD